MTWDLHKSGQEEDPSAACVVPFNKDASGRWLNQGRPAAGRAVSKTLPRPADTEQRQ